MSQNLWFNLKVIKSVTESKRDDVKQENDNEYSLSSVRPSRKHIQSRGHISSARKNLRDLRNLFLVVFISLVLSIGFLCYVSFSSQWQ